MNWTGEAYAEAARRDRADTDWYALSAESLFAEGAEWLRNQLRTPEAVERVADALFDEHEGCTIAQHERECPRPDCGYREEFTRRAHEVIDALLGEDA